MKNFNRDNKSGRGRGDRKFGGRDFRGRGGSRGFDDRGSDRPSMHEAVCDNCGKDCEVPFRPTGEKPVYCSDCFKTMGGGSNTRSFGDRDSRRQSFGDRRMFQAVCDSCGKDCEVPFQPSGDKPVYCSDCFSQKGSGTRDKSSGSLEKQFEMLSSKLDAILKVLRPKASKEPVLGEEKAKVLSKPEKTEDKKVKKISSSKKESKKKKAAQ